MPTDKTANYWAFINKRFAGVLDFVHCPVFKNLENTNVSALFDNLKKNTLRGLSRTPNKRLPLVSELNANFCG
jgi:hypothetical protein